MAEKVIPGIPHATRIAILQQTEQDEKGISAGLSQDRTVLEHVLSSDESRNEAVRKAECKSTPLFVLRTANRFHCKSSQKHLRQKILWSLCAQFGKSDTSKRKSSCFWPTKMQV